jgi:PAS domain S-box-containing protein
MNPTQVEDLAGRLARAAQASAHAVVLCDPAGRIEWVNDGFVAMTGFDPAEAQGRRPADLLYCPEADAEAVAQVAGHLQAGEGFRAELLARGKGGRLFWMDMDVRPTRDPAGVPEGFVWILSEVTPAHELRERLNATAAALRQASRLAQLGGWRVNLRTGQVRWTSELQALLGRPAIEDAEESLVVYAAEERDLVRRQVAEAARTGERVDFEARGFDAQGRPIWLRVMGEPEFVDGRCVTLVGASQDVTAQREATASLQESERFGRGVIDGMAGLLAVIDETGAIVAANAAFRRKGAELRGEPYSPLGLNMFDIVRRLPRGHGRRLERDLRNVLEGRAESLARAYEALDGEWFRMTASRFVGEGPVRCVVVTQSIDDIKRSERRLKELNLRLRKARDEADAASRAKSAFLATMSHEIRTPLNGVLGMAQAMERDELPARQRERLGVIRQAGETLLALLNDLLDLSRIEAGRLDLEDGAIDVEALMEGVKATFTTLATEKDLSLQVEVEAQARGLWRGDPTRVRQILYNLVSNAVKFTAAGSVRAVVSRAKDELVIQVSDTGPGIAPDRLEALFEKFVQEDASTTRRFGGSGLGLAICRELAALMGGRIAACSRLGEGSVFTVCLPLPRAVEAARPVATPLAAAPTPEIRILAAEDNPMNQLVLKTLLAQLGLEVVCVGDGRQALAAYDEGDWDVILMDVQMPVMDGPTAARGVRERERAAGRRRTPIIALTANAMAHQEAEYRLAGMDAVVAKPLELEKLIAALGEVLEAADAA